jgi:hypothetical protein
MNTPSHDPSSGSEDRGTSGIVVSWPSPSPPRGGGDNLLDELAALGREYRRESIARPEGEETTTPTPIGDLPPDVSSVFSSDVSSVLPPAARSASRR